MKASELLTALTLPQKKQTYQGIAQLDQQNLLPITQIRQEGDKLVFRSLPGQAPLAMKDLLTILMTHRRLALYLETKATKQPIYGFKERDNQIIL